LYLRVIVKNNILGKILMKIAAVCKKSGCFNSCDVIIWSYETIVKGGI